MATLFQRFANFTFFWYSYEERSKIKIDALYKFKGSMTFVSKNFYVLEGLIPRWVTGLVPIGVFASPPIHADTCLSGGGLANKVQKQEEAK